MGVLQEQFTKEISKQIGEKIGVKNPMAVPRLSKVVVNMGVKGATADKKNLERAQAVLVRITGQKPKITRARKAIAGFKLRQGDEIGLITTLRGKRMYDFFEKLVSVVLPRLRDFHGVSRESFDGKGNYSLGLSEYAVFPEIDPGKMDLPVQGQGMEITIVTTARDDREGEVLFETLGMPFRKG